MTSNLALALSANTNYVGSKNDGTTFTFNTGSSCSTNGNCIINGNTMASSSNYYYNWFAATAGTGKTTDVNIDTDGSICPKGWKLPSSLSGKTYEFLISDSYNITSGEQYTSIDSFPLSFTRGFGYTRNGSDSTLRDGQYISSTAGETNSEYASYFTYYPPFTQGGYHYSGLGFRAEYYKYTGRAIRCVNI